MPKKKRNLQEAEVDLHANESDAENTEDCEVLHILSGLKNGGEPIIAIEEAHKILDEARIKIAKNQAEQRKQAKLTESINRHDAFFARKAEEVRLKRSELKSLNQQGMSLISRYKTLLK